MSCVHNNDLKINILSPVCSISYIFIMVKIRHLKCILEWEIKQLPELPALQGFFSTKRARLSHSVHSAKNRNQTNPKVKYLINHQNRNFNSQMFSATLQCEGYRIYLETNIFNTQSEYSKHLFLENVWRKSHFSIHKTEPN